MSTYANAATNTAQVPQFPALLTVEEVAQIFRVDDTTVRRWINKGTLEAIILPHTGGRNTRRNRQGYRVPIDAVQRIFNGRQAS